MPKSQLLAQWRELNSIFKKQDNHILINYIYKYGKEKLLGYTACLVTELTRRGYNIKNVDNLNNYFCDTDEYSNKPIGDYPEHNRRYLLQCFYNLQEKYDRGQKDFSEELYKKLEKFVFSS